MIHDPVRRLGHESRTLRTLQFGEMKNFGFPQTSMFGSFERLWEKQFYSEV